MNQLQIRTHIASLCKTRSNTCSTFQRWPRAQSRMPWTNSISRKKIKSKKAVTTKLAKLLLLLLSNRKRRKLKWRSRWQMWLTFWERPTSWAICCKIGPRNCVGRVIVTPNAVSSRKRLTWPKSKAKPSSIWCFKSQWMNRRASSRDAYIGLVFSRGLVFRANFSNESRSVYDFNAKLSFPTKFCKVDPWQRVKQKVDLPIWMELKWEILNF